MRELWEIIRREYMERVRTKVFIIGTFVVPPLLGAILVVPQLMAVRSGAGLRLAVKDETGVVAPTLAERLAKLKVSGKPRFVITRTTASEDALRDDVLRGVVDGALLLHPDVLAGGDLVYYGKHVGNMVALKMLESAANEAISRERLASEGIGVDLAAALLRKSEMRTVKVAASGDQQQRGPGALFWSLALLMILSMSTIMWGQALANGVLEEKGNRIIEVMISSVTPMQLFAGKLLGVGAAGLTQFVVWAVSAATLTLMGGGAALVATGITMPLWMAVAFVGFFLLGFFMYGALALGVGSVCSSTQETNNLMLLANSPLLVAMQFGIVVMMSPEGMFATVASLFPLFTPIVMFLRLAQSPPPAWQVALSVALSLATIAGILWASSRVYRVGILMYGKRPTLPELMRWVREA